MPLLPNLNLVQVGGCLLRTDSMTGIVRVIVHGTRTKTVDLTPLIEFT